MFLNNSIIITTNTNKKDILKSSNKELLNLKIYSIQEFNKLYFFDYDEETIYYVMSKYNVKEEIAKIYLDNMTYINDAFSNRKLNNLYELKQDLIENKLLSNNKLFRASLTNKTIYFYNLPDSKEINYLKELLEKDNKVLIENMPEQNNTHLIYECNTIEEEVVFIASKICDLIKKNISITKIFLTNLNEDYYKLIKRIFPMYHIPFTLNEKNSIYQTFLSTKFFEYYDSNLEITLAKIKEYTTTKESVDIFNIMIDIVNKYTFIEDKNLVKDMIKNDMKNTYLPKLDIPSSVHEKDLKITIFQEDEYVFIVGFNQGILPTIHKDESYLTDKDKIDLPLSLTVDKNIHERNETKRSIKNIKNAVITYNLNTNGEERVISSLNEELKYEVNKVKEMDLTYSEVYNKIKLTSLLDDYYKYGTKSNLLYTLNYHYLDLPYNTYSNTFTGLEKEKLHKYLDNKITLSYSSLDKYFKCPFSYYISHILKLDIYETKFYQVVGTLFHAILEKCLKEDDFEKLWNEEIKNINYEWNTKEQFFLKKLKEELKFIMEVIKEQEQFTNLHDELHEERVYTSISGNIKITFTGIIDKIKYKHRTNDTIVAIIDYKTGNPNLDLTTLPYGIGMQLPVYLYLAKNSKKFEKIQVAGFYLQKILNNEVTVDNNHTYEQLKKKNLLLQGYSNENLEILSEFDTSYTDSNIIKSMKTKKDGDFYNYVKVLSTKDIDTIEKLAEEKINEGAKDITKAKFDIAPKKIGNINYGCSLCKYKDICFHTEKDVIELREKTMEEILGGEENGMDERTTTSN